MKNSVRDTWRYRSLTNTVIRASQESAPARDERKIYRRSITIQSSPKARLSRRIPSKIHLRGFLVGALMDAPDNWEPFSSTFFSTWIKYIHIDSYEYSRRAVIEEDYLPSGRNLRSVGLRPSSPSEPEGLDILKLVIYSRGVVYTFFRAFNWSREMRSLKWDSASKNVSNRIKLHALFFLKW